MGVREQETEQPFGDLLRSLRARAGLTQQEVAERANLTVDAVSALERGTRTRPYPHTVRALADALGVDEREREALVRAVPSRGRATRSEPAPAGRPLGLVVPPTTLHGREGDVAAVCELVRGRAARLVTLTGPGGVGKTRLAAALSDELRPDHPGGVVQVSLAPLSDADQVLPSIGRALGITGADGDDALNVLTDHLRTRRLLLVLDNFEHLLSAAAAVGRLSAQCPDLTVLVSSRSPLRLRGEQEYGVAPLGLPCSDADTVEELASAPAGALVLDRARAVSPRLVLTAEEVGALAALCHRLSGLPLAIELATAQLRLLSPHTLLDRLEEALTRSGARDLPERQRTMRTTLDWSYGLLQPEEQRLFTLLSAFRGGATLESAEAVAAASGDAPRHEVLGLLEGLVEQSLVVVEPAPDGDARFAMLEPVASYARSLLVGDRFRRVAHAHAAVFLELATTAARGYESDDQVEWLARVEPDEANVVIAVERSLDLDDPATSAAITWSMWLYWWLRGQLSVGRRLAEACLERDLAPGLRGRAHLAAATMSYAAGDVEAGARHWTEATALGRAERDPELGSKAVAGLGLAALTTGDLQGAVAHLTEAATLGDEAGERGRWITTLVHVWLGTALLLQGDQAKAVREMETGLALARDRGDRLATYIALYNLSQAALSAGDHARARHCLDEGIRLSEQTRDLANLAYFLETLAVVESVERRPARVAGLLGAASGLRETVGANVYAYYLPDESLRAEAERGARAALGEEYDVAAQQVRDRDLGGIVAFALTPGA